MNGPGKYSWPDGKEYYGEWENGKEIGEGYYNYKNNGFFSKLLFWKNR